MKIAVLTLVAAVWRHRLDDHLHSTCPSHDSRCRVGTLGRTLGFAVMEAQANRSSASSTLVSPGESLRCHSYGSPSWRLVSSPSSGSSGAFHYPSHTALAAILEISRTSDFETYWPHRLLGALASPIYSSPSTKACSQRSRKSSKG